MVLDDHRSSVKEMALKLDMSHMSIHNILIDILSMKHIAAQLERAEFFVKKPSKACC